VSVSVGKESASSAEKKPPALKEKEKKIIRIIFSQPTYGLCEKWQLQFVFTLWLKSRITYNKMSLVVSAKFSFLLA